MNSALCQSMHCHRSLNTTGFYWPSTLVWLFNVTKVVKRRHYLIRSSHIQSAQSITRLPWNLTTHSDRPTLLVQWCLSERCISYIGWGKTDSGVKWTLKLFLNIWKIRGVHFTPTMGEDGQPFAIVNRCSGVPGTSFVYFGLEFPTVSAFGNYAMWWPRS